ncbi:MAG: O-succinylbenzoic acid--CoA ligase [Chlamydiales bacterium]|jgi:O-succinylbenzoic acid--CoA ligase
MSNTTKIIPDPLIEAAQSRPNACGLISPMETLSFSQYNNRVWACVNSLQRKGVRSGDRVGILLNPSHEMIILFMALFRMGAAACPLNMRIPTQEMSRQLQEISCRFVIADFDGDLRIPVISPEECFRENDQEFPEKVMIDLAQEATVLFTSGSSGSPKAAKHSYGNHYYSAIGSNANIPLSHNDRWVLSLPLYHVGGLAILMRCLIAQSAVVIPDMNDKNFLAAIEVFHPSHISLVSTQLRRLLQENLSVSKCILLGGSAIPEGLISEAYARDWPLYKSYGMTEMSSQITTTPPGAELRQLFSSGKLLAHREIRVSDEGEVLVKGDSLFQGYVGHDNLDDSEYYTGDLGFFDDEGYLHIIGRKDNLFISGGENIQPEEIESVLQNLDGVQRALVVPIKDEEYGFRPIAFIDGTDWKKELLRAGLEELLPRYKIPVEFYPWPMTRDEDSLKVQRKEFHSLVNQRAVMEEGSFLSPTL